MEALVVPAMGGTGRLIVRFRRSHGSLEGERNLPRVDLIEGDAC
jgi:hypothetical protein